MSRVSSPAQPRRSADAPAADAIPPAGRWPFADDDDTGDDLAVQRKQTTAAEAGVHKPAGVPASVFEAGKMAKATVAARRCAEPIDLDSVVIEADVPITSRRVGRAASRLHASCNALLDRMQTGQSVLLPSAQGQALVRIARKLGRKVQRRIQPDGTWRVWRLADPQQPQGAAS